MKAKVPVDMYIKRNLFSSTQREWYEKYGWPLLNDVKAAYFIDEETRRVVAVCTYCARCLDPSGVANHYKSNKCRLRRSLREEDLEWLGEAELKRQVEFHTRGLTSLPVIE